MSKELEKVKSLRMERREEWVMERRPVELKIEEMGEQKPHILMCVSVGDGLIIGSTIVDPDADDSEMISWALNCMTSPMVGKPRRPGAVTLVGGMLGTLRAPLEEAGIQVQLRSLPHHLVDSLISQMETDLGAPGFEPYTTEDGVKEDTVADFFKAAAEFYRLQPWRFFGFEVPMKLDLHLKKRTELWAVVMGVGGEEFGLTAFKSGADVVTMFRAESEKESHAVVEKAAFVGFSYEHFDNIGPIAQSECIVSGFELADKSAYPFAIVMDPKLKDKVRRPNQQDLIELTAATRVATAFLTRHHAEIEEEEEPIIVDAVQVYISGKPVDAHVSFPAPEFLEEDEDWLEDLTPSEMAAELIYEASMTSSRKKRMELAQEAIDVCPDCVEAYIVLALDTPTEKKSEILGLLQQAVEAGRRAIGEKDFKKLQGNFWLAPETRPYMRAKVTLALFEGKEGMLDEAIKDYQEMLRLNPEDSLGMRYHLSILFFRTNRDSDLERLLKKYKDDVTAFWLYNTALFSFRNSGESERANKDLAKAMVQNDHVPEYMLGRKHMPKQLPQEHTWGSKEEAILYVSIAQEAWKSTEGALDWLRNAPRL